MEPITSALTSRIIPPALAEAFKRFVHRHYAAEIQDIQRQSARLPEDAQTEYTRHCMDRLLLKMLMDSKRRNELEVIFSMFAQSSGEATLH